MSKEPDFHSRVGTAVRPHRSSPDVTAPAPAGAPPSDSAAITHGASCWSRSGDVYFPTSHVVAEVPAGAYRCINTPHRGPAIAKMPIEVDNLLALPDSAVEYLVAEFKKFWRLQKNFADRGYIFKRGMLMWGPPGSGKTSAIWQMTQILVKEHNGIVIFVEGSELATACLRFARDIEPKRPMITVMEDLDALVENQGEHGYLAILDGETQIANVVHLATTNYPERLDKRFVDRPSRFDTIMFIGMPTARAREEYFRAKEPSLTPVELKRWVKRTEDYSIAHLREVIIAIKCFDQPEHEVFARLDDMREKRLASDGQGGERRKMGII